MPPHEAGFQYENIVSDAWTVPSGQIRGPVTENANGLKVFASARTEKQAVSDKLGLEAVKQSALAFYSSFALK